MKKRARVDANQQEIVQALRKCGASVLSLAVLGKGVPDLLISIGNKTLMVEIKDGRKPPSKRKLTADQETFHAQWPGEIAVVTSVDEVLEIVGLKIN